MAEQKNDLVQQDRVVIDTPEVTFEPSTDEQQTQLVRKLDHNIVPLIMVLYLVAFLDRSNIGNARIAGMSDDLSLTGDRYDWLLTIFYVSYIIFQAGILGWKLFKPHQWASVAVLVWGICASCQAAVQNWQSEMALRFFMGAGEACFGTGAVYYLSFFYLRHEIGARAGFYLSAAPLASSFAGALAYGITSGHSKLANWRLLLLVEGLMAIIIVPFTFLYLPDSPASARFLNEEEKLVAASRGIQQVGKAGEDRLGNINFKEVAMTFLDLKAWFTALIYFSCNVSFASLPVFLPTIIEEMGFTSIHSQGLSAPPFLLSFIVTCATTFIADRLQQRGYMVASMATIGGVGYIILATSHSVGARYFATYLAASGVFPAIGNVLPWILNNQGSDSRRGSSLMIATLIGQCGPVLGTRLYPVSEAPYYVKGQAVCAAFMFFTVLLALSLRLVLVRENRFLDEKYGSFKAANEASTELKSYANRRTLGAVGGVANEDYGARFRFIL